MNGMIPCEKGHFDIVQRLLAYPLPGKLGTNVKALLNLGVDSNAVNHQGYSAFDVASTDAIRKLLNEYKKPSSSSSSHAFSLFRPRPESNDKDMPEQKCPHL